MSDRERIKQVLAETLEPMFYEHRWLLKRNEWINIDYWRTEDGERKRVFLTVDINKLADALIPLIHPHHNESPKT